MGANGDCFPAAGRWLGDHDSHGDCVMVHGVVAGLGELDGVQFPHAWVECGGDVIDPSNGNTVSMSKKKYYKLGRIQEKYSKKYSLTETYKNMLKFKHWGPWDKTLLNWKIKKGNHEINW